MDIRVCGTFKYRLFLKRSPTFSNIFLPLLLLLLRVKCTNYHPFCTQNVTNRHLNIAVVFCFSAEKYIIVQHLSQTVSYLNTFENKFTQKETTKTYMFYSNVCVYVQVGFLVFQPVVSGARTKRKKVGFTRFCNHLLFKIVQIDLCPYMKLLLLSVFLNKFS